TTPADAATTSPAPATTDCATRPAPSSTKSATAATNNNTPAGPQGPADRKDPHDDHRHRQLRPHDRRAARSPPRHARPEHHRRDRRRRPRDRPPTRPRTRRRIPRVPLQPITTPGRAARPGPPTPHEQEHDMPATIALNPDQRDAALTALMRQEDLARDAYTRGEDTDL